jgi:hypothetical protein
MTRKVLVVLLASVLMAGAAVADPILGPNDPIIAIDTDGIVSASSYPAAENPTNILDNNPATKYLNGGGSGSGFIVTLPAAMPVGSFIMTTANDAATRDPANWELYGTNDPIKSLDNTAGIAENWTLIAKGDANLPDTRLTVGPVISFESFEVYTSFKMLFPKTKGSNLMQIADVAFYPLPDGQGPNLLVVGTRILAVEQGWQSNYPAAEAPAKCIDGNPETKYLNFGKENSGFIVTPLIGPSTLDSFQITTANDSPERDPVVWMVYGTNDAITSVDNSDGRAENWTLICGGTLALPAERKVAGPIYVIANQAEPYTSYKTVFQTVKNAASTNSMQIADIQFFGTPVPVVEVPVEVPVEPQL